MQVKSSLFFLCLANWTQFCVIKTSNPSLNAGIMAHDSVLWFLMKFASSAQICYSYIISIRIPARYYSLTFSKCLKNHLFRHFLFLLPLDKGAPRHAVYGKGLSPSACIKKIPPTERRNVSAAGRSGTVCAADFYVSTSHW